MRYLIVLMYFNVVTSVENVNKTVNKQIYCQYILVLTINYRLHSTQICRLLSCQNDATNLINMSEV